MGGRSDHGLTHPIADQEGHAGRARLPQLRQLPAAAAIALQHQVADSSHRKTTIPFLTLGGVEPVNQHNDSADRLEHRSSARTASAADSHASRPPGPASAKRRSRARSTWSAAVCSAQSEAVQRARGASDRSSFRTCSATQARQDASRSPRPRRRRSRRSASDTIGPIALPGLVSAPPGHGVSNVCSIQEAIPRHERCSNVSSREFVTLGASPRGLERAGSVADATGWERPAGRARPRLERHHDREFPVLGRARGARQWAAAVAGAGQCLRPRAGAAPAGGREPAAYQATSEALAAQVVAAALPGLVLERFHELSQQSRPGGLLTLKVLLLHPRLQPVPWELLADSEALRSIAAPVVVWRGVRSERAFPPAPESSLLLLGSAPADVSSTHAEDEFRLIGEQFEARPESAPTRIHGYRSVR